MTLRELLNGEDARLGLRALSGARGLDRPVRVLPADGRPEGLPGIFKVLSREDQRRAARRTAGIPPAEHPDDPVVLIVLAQTRRIPDWVQAFVEARGVTAAASRFDPYLLESRLIGLVREKCGRTVVRHAGLIEIGRRGVLIVGESGAGKTACALCLARCGARWVADDRVEISRSGDRLIGRSPRGLRGRVALRTPGGVRIARFPDAGSIATAADLSGIVELASSAPEGGRDRRSSGPGEEAILGVTLPRARISPATHRTGCCAWATLSGAAFGIAGGLASRLPAVCPMTFRTRRAA